MLYLLTPTSARLRVLALGLLLICLPCEYHRLVAEFPALTVPTFSAAIDKHGVEHFITTVGPTLLGPQFTSELWTTKADNLGVKLHLRTTPSQWPLRGVPPYCEGFLVGLTIGQQVC
ncbi:hypothetical protein GOODEAATRI_008377 [Goodea atripinnis]|uniref:Uncharacterized protein n=1 Tax=Goodea atripinnis TaxID=208336 RepID=A0ABV0MQD7_9TELE